MATNPVVEHTLGHYRLLECLGRGGMGIVYRARDEHLQRDVALKVLPPNVVKDESARRRLRREAVTLARLNHPHIGTLHDFGTERDVDFLVMEYIPGVTLASKLATGPVREPELIDIALQLASALEEAHKQGVIHRDLKPANILITPAGQVKVLDFGLAQLLAPGENLDTATSSNDLAGTMPYVPPEELSNAKCFDARGDLYALGTVLYEMATGRRAYPEQNLAALVESILHKNPESIRKLNPSISPSLEATIAKAMDKNPDLRYQTAAELKVDLRRMVSSSNIEFSTLPSRRRIGRRWVVALLATVAALSLGFELLRLTSITTPSVLASPRTVAVLPFESVGGNAESPALCRGLTDLLTTRLIQTGKDYAVQVVPASDVRTQAVDSIEAARRKLGVSLVVEGSWDFSTSRVMYTLIDARTHHSLNAESAQADLSDLLTAERKISDGLLRMIAGEVSPESRVAQEASPNPDAYEYYVRGIGHLSDYQDVKHLNASIALFDSALQKHPKFAAAAAAKAEALWRMYDETKDESWVPKAEQVCQQALQLNDRLASAHVTLGIIFAGQGKHGDAVKEFRRAIELDAGSDAAYRGLAASYEALGENTEAEHAYLEAIGIRKNYWGGYSALGTFYFRTARYDDAVTQFRQVVALAPENVRGYSNLGAILILQDKTAQAEEVLRKSIALEPNYRAYSNLGTLYFAQARFAESAQAFEQALQWSKGDGRVWRNLGDAYHYSGQKPKAHEAYSQAAALLKRQLKVNPTDPKLMIEIALCDSMLGNQNQALEMARRAGTLLPHDPEILFRTAEIYAQAGNQRTSLDWLKRAVQAGYSISEVVRDPTFEPLRQDSRYKALVQPRPVKSD